MHFRNSEQSYGLVAMLLHWVAALVVLGLFGVGLWMTDLTYYDDWYRKAPHLHKSVGVLLALVFVFRLIWRYVNPKPKLDASVPQWEERVAGLVHFCLYLLVFAIVLSGYFISTADGRAIEVFDWFEIPALVTAIENQEDLAGDIHFYLASSLIGLVVLHALAALKHHFIDGDNTLKRMLNPNFSTDISVKTLNKE